MKKEHIIDVTDRGGATSTDSLTKYEHMMYEIASIDDDLKRRTAIIEFVKVVKPETGWGTRDVTKRIVEIRKEAKRCEYTKEGENASSFLRDRMNLVDYDASIPWPFTYNKKQLGDNFIWKFLEDEAVPLCPAYAISHIITGETTKARFVSVKGKSIIMDISISDTNEINELFGNRLLGFPVANIINDIKLYNYLFVQKNGEIIPKLRGIDCTGWQGDGNFYLPSLNIKNTICTNNRVNDAFQLAGDKREQYKKLKLMLSTPAGVTILSSLAAPLVEICETPNLVMNYHGRSRSGKTVAVAYSMSIWGSHDELKGSWSGTKTGKEFFSSLRDVPTWLDEAQDTDTKRSNMFLDHIYDYVGGKGGSRGRVQRGTGTVGLAKITRYRGSLLITSEKDMQTFAESVRGLRKYPVGIFGRVVEIDWNNKFFLPFSTEGGRVTINSSDDSPVITYKELLSFSAKNYGHVGVDFVNSLLKKGHDEIKKLYDSVYAEIENNRNAENMEWNFALLITAAKLLDELLIKELGEEDKDVCKNLIDWIKEDVLPRHGEAFERAADYAQKFLEAVEADVFSNPGLYVGFRTKKIQERNYELEYEIKSRLSDRIRGRIIQTGSKEGFADVFLLPPTFHEICQKNSLIENQVIQGLKEKNRIRQYTTTRRGRHTTTATSRQKIEGKTATGYYILNVIESGEPF